jgi:hypothetical protein
LLGPRQFRQAEELLVSAAAVCSNVAEIFDTPGEVRKAVEIDTANKTANLNLGSPY